MKGPLVFALAVAALSLVVLGERVGLGPQVARAAIVGVLGLTILALALISATSRLGAYLDGESRTAFLKSLAAQALLLLVAFALAMPADLQTLQGGAMLLLGYFVALLALPSSALTSLAEPGFEAGAPSGSHRLPAQPANSRLALRFAGALVALALALAAFPIFHSALASSFRLAPAPALAVSVTLLSLPLLLGGQKAAARLAVHGLLLVAAAIVLPNFGGAIAEGLRGNALAEFAERIRADGSAWAAAGARLPDDGEALRLAAFGVALALVGAASQTHRPKRLQRLGTGLIAALLAIALLMAVETALNGLTALVAREMAGRMPQTWPVFAFDEAITGWLQVCGRAPVDPLDIAGACRRLGIALPPPASAISLDPRLKAEAVALSQGWPVGLGGLWALLPLLLGLAALSLLVQMAATGLSEILLYRALHPRALKAARLAMARFATLAVIGGLALASQAGWRPDARLIEVVAIGSAFALATLLVAAGLTRLVRALGRAPHARPA